MKKDSDFISDLVTADEMKDEAKTAKKEQKEINKIADEIEVYNLGSQYWINIIKQAKKLKLLNLQEEGILLSATKMEGENPVLPSSKQAKKIMEIRKRLEEEGVIV